MIYRDVQDQQGPHRFDADANLTPASFSLSRHGSIRNDRTDSGAKSTQSSHQPPTWAIQHRRTENGSTQPCLDRQRKKKAKIANRPIPTNDKPPTSRQSQLPDCEHPTRRTYITYEIIIHSSRRTGTPRHDGAVFRSPQSRQNHLDRYQQGRTKRGQHQTENSRGNVAQGNAIRPPRQRPIKYNGMETQSQGCSRSNKRKQGERENQCAMEHPLRPPQSLDTVNMVHIPRVRPLPHQDRSTKQRSKQEARSYETKNNTERKWNHRHSRLPPTADKRRSNRTRQKANREQLMVIEENGSARTRPNNDSGAINAWVGRHSTNCCMHQHEP